MTCVPDSTTGSGLWQPMYFPLCPAEGCGSEGVVTSPNHPGNYPHNIDKTQTIVVESGKILRLEFTRFFVYWGSTCQYDFVKITDGDGTTLMDNSCGNSDQDPSSPYYFLPPIITTRSNRVEIFFHTDGSDTRTGWSLSWSAVTSGSVCPPTATGVVNSPNHPDLYPDNLDK